MTKKIQGTGTVQFDTTLVQAEGKKATGIVVPDDLIAQLDRGARPPVRVSINGYEFRTTVGVMGGTHMVGVSAAIRKATGLEAGDAITVVLTADVSPREVEVPPELALALDAEPRARAFFDTLSNSLQRYHVDNINNAKTPETRQRRVDKAVQLFCDGKPR